LFAVELLRLWQMEGRLKVEGTTPVLDERGRDWTRETIEAPTSLREVLGHRLDQLSESDLALLAPASVLGVSFDERLLQTVGGLEAGALAAALERLRAARVIDPYARRPGLSEFAHPLIREILLERFEPEYRRALHARAAAALAAGGREDIEADLAYHY